MLSELIFKTARVLGWPGIVLIVTLSLVPGSLRPTTGAGGQVEHILAYFGTSLMLSIGYRETPQRLVLTVTLCALSAALELAQLWVPGRIASLEDMFAGGLGTMVGISLGTIVPISPARRL